MEIDVGNQNLQLLSVAMERIGIRHPVTWVTHSFASHLPPMLTELRHFVV